MVLERSMERATRFVVSISVIPQLREIGDSSSMLVLNAVVYILVFNCRQNRANGMPSCLLRERVGEGKGRERKAAPGIYMDPGLYQTLPHHQLPSLPSLPSLPPLLSSPCRPMFLSRLPIAPSLRRIHSISRSRESHMTKDESPIYSSMDNHYPDDSNRPKKLICTLPRFLTN